MNNSLSSPLLLGRVRGRVLAALGLALIVGAASLSAQDNTRRRDNSGGNGGGNNGNFNPQDMQARMLTALRERFDVANDEEWGLISDRITKVVDLRRSSMAGAMSMFGRGSPGGGGSDRTNSGGRGSRTSSNVEMSALQAAVTDKLPDAEIKSRLDRYREVKRDNEAKLAKAQEELRAVLSVRQEAVAVLAGLLP